MALPFITLFAGLRHNSYMYKELLTLIGIRQLGCAVDPRRIVISSKEALHETETHSSAILLCGVW